MGVLSLLLAAVDFVPVVNTVVDVIGLVSGGTVTELPSTGGVLGKLVSTVVFFHIASPKIDKFVASTKTKKDNAVWDVLSTVLSYATDILVALGKLDPRELKKKVVSGTGASSGGGNL